MAAKEKRKGDRHKTGFLVRLPEVYRGKFLEHKLKTDRPIAAAIRRAADAYLKENGIEPPVTST
jgi:hypothetical protein